MSWIQTLCKTYDQAIGTPEASEGDNILPPICHTTLMAHIEIVLDIEGNFKRASVIPNKPKHLSRTIVPCTKGYRSNEICAHPLTDNLTYIAGDLFHYLDPQNKEETRIITRNQKGHSDYISKLSKWVNDSNISELKSIYTYVCKDSVCKDLIESGIIPINEKGRIDLKNNKSESIIYKVITETIDKTVIRWIIESPGKPGTYTYKTKEIWNDWQRHFISTIEEKDVCMVTGEVCTILSNHPSKIRNDRDMAKLISSNDSSGFTYRGRFASPDDACTVGLESSYKAHNALGWLIRRQGTHKGDWCEVSWRTNDTKVINPVEDPTDYLSLFPENEPNSFDYGIVSAETINKMIAGYFGTIQEDNVITMVVDSAVPGRLSIIYYREFTQSEYQDNLAFWYSSVSWPRSYYIENEDGKKIQKKTYLPPSLISIVTIAYGEKESEKLKSTLNRLIPCVIERAPFPKDLVDTVVSNTMSPQHFKTTSAWEQSLSLACALYKKINPNKRYTMTLDKNRTDRDYLYGRLLAAADNLENYALFKYGETRQTNAMRLMQKFADRPFSTWRNIDLALMPYRARLGASANYSDSVIGEVMDLFDPEDFKSDKRLSGEFLLGFYTQRSDFRKKKEEE